MLKAQSVTLIPYRTADLNTSRHYTIIILSKSLKTQLHVKFIENIKPLSKYNDYMTGVESRK